MQIVVLNDGTTWTSMAGCVVATVPDDYDGDSPPSVATSAQPVYDGDEAVDNDGQIILYTGVTAA